jgi:hypothetical protein
MSFADTFKKHVEPHKDTPAEAEARANAVAKVHAKEDAKVARADAQAAGKKGDVGAPKPAAPDKAARSPRP